MEITPFKIESIQDIVDRAADYESLGAGERDFLLVVIASMMSGMDGEAAADFLDNLHKVTSVANTLVIEEKRKGALVEYFVNFRNGIDLLEKDEDEDEITVKANAKGVELGFKLPRDVCIDDEVIDTIMETAREALSEAIGPTEAEKAEITIDQKRSRPGFVVMKAVRRRNVDEKEAVKH